MKPKRKATNWRKIYEASAMDRDYYKSASLEEHAAVNKKQAATNWRKRAEIAEFSLSVEQAAHLFWQTQCEAAAERWKKYEKMTHDLRGQIEVGDALIDKQRERLIRLTRVMDFGNTLTQELRTIWKDVPITAELDGVGWMRVHSLDRVICARRHYESAVAALEVDTAIPLKEKP
jgi:hypothetical protein